MARNAVHPLLVVLLSAALASASAPAHAFTQKSAITCIGHESIIVSAGRRLPLPDGGKHVDGPTAACRFCDTYGTTSWRLWSAVLGNRWADIGGYDVVFEKARAKVFGPDGARDIDCFDAVVQDAEGAQYQHALRTRADLGPEGVRRVHDGTRALIHDRFMMGVRAPEEPMWVRDGGVTVAYLKADRPYFYLGLALHALEDSFSEEHTKRSDDWHTITNYKTYVATPGVDPHATPENDRTKYLWHGLVPQPNAKHGDYIFQNMFTKLWSLRTGGVKPSVWYARDASADLMAAFQSARSQPASAEDAWAKFEGKWLRFTPDADALRTSTDPVPQPSTLWQDVWHACQSESGENFELAGYPPFCWPASKCSEDYAALQLTAGEQAARAADALGGGLATSFAQLPGAIEDPRDRAPSTLGSHAADRAGALALQFTDSFFVQLGDSYVMLDEKERRNAIEPRLRGLEVALRERSAAVRDAACARARRWAATEAEGRAKEAGCRSEFDAGAPDRERNLASLVTQHIQLGLKPLPEDGLFPTTPAPVAPPSAPPTPAPPAPPPPPPPPPQMARPKKGGSMPSGATTASPAAAPPAAAPPGGGVPAPTGAALTDAFYRKLQACIGDSASRVLDPLGHEGVCRKTYEADLAGAGLR